ncbi:hypothetical protein INR49_024846, partial [Caranx melampygus]
MGQIDQSEVGLCSAHAQCPVDVLFLTIRREEHSAAKEAFSRTEDNQRKSPVTMAAAPGGGSSTKGSLREDLTCAICCDLFRDPVMLACMHHFCRPCISRYWRGTQGPVTCPQCRKEFSCRQFQTNYLVTAMVEKVRATTSDTYVQNLQKQLRESLESYRLRREDYSNSISRDKDKMDTIKRFGADLQARVKSEFRVLHQILDDEETCVLEQLRREQEEELEKVERHLEAVKLAVRDLEENIRTIQQASTATENIPLTELPQLSGRQARIKLSPENGFWTLRLRNRNEYSAGTQPWTRLQLSSSLQRVGVFLDCEERRVSFYNTDDMSLLYSFANGPRGKVKGQINRVTVVMPPGCSMGLRGMLKQDAAASSADWKSGTMNCTTGGLLFFLHSDYMGM